MAQCTALDDPKSAWDFCPSVAAAYVLAVAFALSTVLHLYQAIRTRKPYCAVITLGTAWQMLAFIFRILSIDNPTNYSHYSTWFVLILVAPIWTNAFVYMVMGRMVYNFLARQSLCGIQAWRFGLYFVVLDVVAFLVQLGGAGMATGQDVPLDQVMRGLHIYMGGVGFQQAVIIGFAYLAFKFTQQLRREPFTERTPAAWRLTYVIGVVLVLITVSRPHAPSGHIGSRESQIRIIFRLVEYASGLESTIPRHEAYMYCLDTLPMLVASVLFNVVHPGSVMAGKESDMPGCLTRRKARKGQQIVMS
ncbi:MAG: hypothetical protein M1832_000277 [Thelocarpon impressellum]|nr:MAG: hypothetical protein M1832_000277 [Thelocarpon impressellum]